MGKLLESGYPRGVDAHSVHLPGHGAEVVAPVRGDRDLGETDGGVEAVHTEGIPCVRHGPLHPIGPGTRRQQH